MTMAYLPTSPKLSQYKHDDGLPSHVLSSVSISMMMAYLPTSPKLSQYKHDDGLPSHKS